MKARIKISLLFLAVCMALAVSCSKGSTDSGGGSDVAGQGGSMACFAITDDILYVVDKQTLKIFDISSSATPQYLSMKDQKLDFGVETIFVMDTLLFIGSETGMYIYDITLPDFPQKLAFVSHVRSCDPVVASDNYAYVTLNSEHIQCGRTTNQLIVYDISNPRNPMEMNVVEMQAPRGLGVDGKKLFVCDEGLKVYDIENPLYPRWIDDLSHIPEAQNIDAYDVIPYHGVLVLTGANGLYQFDYTGERLRFLSKITVEK